MVNVVIQNALVVSNQRGNNMAKKYTGSLSLEWFNKNRSIITQLIEDKRENDVPAPRINWINKDEALFYEISEDEGKGLTPYWVDRNDIRVKESRPFVFQKAYKSILSGDKYEVEESEIDDPEIDNILIKGDNLLALNTLKKMFDQKPDDEKVKCVFIDPPYNTRSAFAEYDDNIAHSEWLTLLRDRLVLLRSVLSENGSIWITIDDDESHYLKALCDEIFGRNNFISNVVWQKKFSPQNDARWISDNHDHILIYAKNKDFFEINLLPRTDEMNDRFKNPDNDSRGPWTSSDMTVKTYSASYDYPITTPSGRIIMPTKGRCWFTSRERMELLIKDNRVWFGKSGDNVPRIKKFISEVKGGITPISLWLHEEVGHNQEAKQDLKKIFDSESTFSTPKPERLLERILYLGSSEGDYILDVFGGSGTSFSTAQKMNRKWIGVELGDHTDTIIIPRLKKVLSGTDLSGITEKMNWKGGGAFKYYYLGKSIIVHDREGIGDFNWSLGREFIEKSLLATYDFVLDESFPAPGSTVEDAPKVGFNDVNNSTMAGVVSLSSPDEDKGALDNEYINELIAAIRKYKSPQSITIFTNRGVEMAWESKPEDVEIIKVPHAIFAELER